MNKRLTTRVKDIARRSGADLIGIARSESFSSAPKDHHPDDILRGAKSVIVMAARLLDPSLEKAPSREYSITYAVVNRELDRIAYQVARFLQDEGFRAVQVPASPPYDLAGMMGDLSHRHAGHLAGLGIFGKNNLLLSPEFGPRIRLVSVITDASLAPDKPLIMDLCGDCARCIDACPAKALRANRLTDKRKCDEHHVQLGERLQLDDWMEACGVCLRVCPVGRKKTAARPARGRKSLL